MLSDRINDLLQQVEVLGCDGLVEEAQGVMKLCDQLKAERDELKQVSQCGVMHFEVLKAVLITESLVSLMKALSWKGIGSSKR